MVSRFEASLCVFVWLFRPSFGEIISPKSIGSIQHRPSPAQSQDRTHCLDSREVLFPTTLGPTAQIPDQAPDLIPTPWSWQTKNDTKKAARSTTTFIIVVTIITVFILTMFTTFRYISLAAPCCKHAFPQKSYLCNGEVGESRSPPGRSDQREFEGQGFIGPHFGFWGP